MKKLFALLIITTVLMSIPLVAATSAIPPISKIVFVHRADGFAKPEGKPVRPPKPAPEESEPYELLGKGVEWKELNLKYVINPTNFDGLSDIAIASAITTAAEAWDSASSSELFYDYTSITFDNDAEIDTVSPDYKNEIVFETISDSNTIAMCIVWGRFYGPPSSREIIEFDIIFNEYYKWGNVDDDPTVMDLQNIVTHELGHGLGLADLYDQTPTVIIQTMYGYASKGETDKRTLENGDIAGVKALYG